MSQDRQIKAVNLGWDMGRPGGDKTVYYCQTHGHMESPCVCINSYFKSQVREAEMIRQRKFGDGDRMLTNEFRNELKRFSNGRS